MVKALQTRALSLVVVLYFARNPDEELTTTDIGLKYEVDPREVQQRLSRVVRDGLLELASNGRGRRLVMYRAGDVLKEHCGLPQQRDEPRNETVERLIVGRVSAHQRTANLSHEAG